jgi:hypothetical protein
MAEGLSVSPRRHRLETTLTHSGQKNNNPTTTYWGHPHKCAMRLKKEEEMNPMDKANLEVCGNNDFEGDCSFSSSDVSLFCHGVIGDIMILWRQLHNTAELCKMRGLYVSTTSDICPDYLDLDDIFYAEMSLFNLNKEIREFHNRNAKSMDATENRFFLTLKYEITLLRSYFENIYQACDGSSISSDNIIRSDFFDLDSLCSVVNSFKVLKEKIRAFYEQY